MSEKKLDLKAEIDEVVDVWVKNGVFKSREDAVYFAALAGICFADIFKIRKSWINEKYLPLSVKDFDRYNEEIIDNFWNDDEIEKCGLGLLGLLLASPEELKKKEEKKEDKECPTLNRDIHVNP